MGKPDKPGYHVRKIKRGVLGTSSKIREELEELEDAEEQGVKLMIAQELADIIGTVRAYLEANLPTFTLDDLISMNAVTRRAFENGHRREPTQEEADPDPVDYCPRPHAFIAALDGELCSICKCGAELYSNVHRAKNQDMHHWFTEQDTTYCLNCYGFDSKRGEFNFRGDREGPCPGRY